MATRDSDNTVTQEQPRGQEGGSLWGSPDLRLGTPLLPPPL